MAKFLTSTSTGIRVEMLVKGYPNLRETSLLLFLQIQFSIHYLHTTNLLEIAQLQHSLLIHHEFVYSTNANKHDIEGLQIKDHN